MDKFGETGDASLTQRVKSPYKDVGPPYASVTSSPKQSTVDEPVEFDASKSHDADNKPCTSYVWNSGDGTPKQTTDVPRTKHPYKKCGIIYIIYICFRMLDRCFCINIFIN